MLKISLLFIKIQTLRVNNSRILTIKNAKFSGCYFYMNPNIWGEFQICISVPLKTSLNKQCLLEIERSCIELSLCRNDRN